MFSNRIIDLPHIEGIARQYLEISHLEEGVQQYFHKHNKIPSKIFCAPITYARLLKEQVTKHQYSDRHIMPFVVFSIITEFGSIEIVPEIDIKDINKFCIGDYDDFADYLIECMLVGDDY